MTATAKKATPKPVATRVYNSIDQARFNPDRVRPAPIREELGLGEDTRLIGQIAQITPMRNRTQSGLGASSATIVVLRKKAGAATWNIMALRLMAFGRCSRGTSVGTSAWRAGRSKVPTEAPSAAST